MSTEQNQKGFSIPGAIVAVIVMAALVVSGFLVWKNNNEAGKPAHSSNQNNKKDQPAQNNQPQAPDPYEGWQTYTNNTYGISFRYPADWKVEADGPTTSPNSATRQEYAVVIGLKEEFKYNETLSIEMHDLDVSGVAAWYDRYYAQSSQNKVTKEQVHIKGKDAIHYTVVNTEKTELYLFAVADKTYAVSSVGSTKLDPDFWPKFDKLFESLQISIAI